MACVTPEPIDVIEVTSTAVETAEANMVAFEFGIFENRKSVAEAFRESEATAKKVLSELYSIGVPREAVRAKKIEADLNYVYQDTEYVLKGYKCTRGYKVKLEKGQLKLAERAVQVVLGPNRANQFGNLSWSLTPDIAKDLRVRAMVKARIAAKEKAELLAHELGYTLGRLVSVSEEEKQNTRIRTHKGARLRSRASSTTRNDDVNSVTADTVSERAEVTLTFKLEPKDAPTKP